MDVIGSVSFVNWCIWLHGYYEDNSLLWFWLPNSLKMRDRGGSGGCGETPWLENSKLFVTIGEAIVVCVCVCVFPQNIYIPKYLSLVMCLFVVYSFLNYWSRGCYINGRLISNRCYDFNNNWSRFVAYIYCITPTLGRSHPLTFHNHVR